MNDYLVLVRAQVSTVLKVTAENHEEAARRAQSLFEAAHTSNVDMVMGEIIQNPESGEGQW